MASAGIADQGYTGHSTASRAARAYQRHRPESTLLYQLVDQHYPVFRDQLANQGIDITLANAMQQGISSRWGPFSSC